MAIFRSSAMCLLSSLVLYFGLKLLGGSKIDIILIFLVAIGIVIYEAIFENYLRSTMNDTIKNNQNSIFFICYLTGALSFMIIVFHSRSFWPTLILGILILLVSMWRLNIVFNGGTTVLKKLYFVSTRTLLGVLVGNFLIPFLKTLITL